MKKKNKLITFLKGAAGFGILAYVLLFIVFFFDLDGKFLFYIWEPFIVKHYDAMERPDMTKMPYGSKDPVEE